MIQPQRPKRRREVAAPPAEGEGAVNRINSVVVTEDQDVEWQWTPLPEGGRFVSGYTIVSRLPDKISERRTRRT